jgi:hypothetical protein
MPTEDFAATVARLARWKTEHVIGVTLSAQAAEPFVGAVVEMEMPIAAFETMTPADVWNRYFFPAFMALRQHIANGKSR